MNDTDESTSGSHQSSNAPLEHHASGLVIEAACPPTEPVPHALTGDEIEDKWSDARFRKKYAKGPWGLRAEGMTQVGGLRYLVMANGPRHATTYRLCKEKGEMAGFNVPVLLDLEESSIGMRDVETEERVKGKKSKKSFRYGSADAIGIQGVAWYVNESILKDHPNYFPTAVDLLKPKSRPSDFPIAKYDKGGIPRGRVKIVDCVVKIRWRIEGKFVSTWESRETARRIFGGEPQGDNIIYNAAKIQEHYFDQWSQNVESDVESADTPWRSGLEPTPEREVTPVRMSDRGATPGGNVGW